MNNAGNTETAFQVQYPLEQMTAENLSWIGAKVQVKSVTGQTFEGFICSIDPSTGSLFLLSETQDSSQQMKLIVGKNISRLLFLESSQLRVDPTSLKNEEAEDSEELAQKREAVKERLTKLRVPFEECGQELLILNQVKLLAPYTSDDCYSVNEVILSRVKHLLET